MLVFTISKTNCKVQWNERLYFPMPAETGLPPEMDTEGVGCVFFWETSSQSGFRHNNKKFVLRTPPPDSEKRASKEVFGLLCCRNTMSTVLVFNSAAGVVLCCLLPSLQHTVMA